MYVVETLVENISSPFGYHQGDHYWQSVADLVGRFDQDHSQADGHADYPTKK